MNNKGFTLIELLIVVAILGILAVIAIPQLTKYKKKGAAAAAQQAIASCMRKLGAENSDNSSFTMIQCNIPESSDEVFITLNSDDKMTLSKENLKVKSININCEIIFSNNYNEVYCNPSE